MITAAKSFTVVIGLGRSGIGAARLLASRGEKVLLIESQHSAELERQAIALEAEGIEVQLAMPLEPASFMKEGQCAQTVVVSPGIRWDHPVLEELRQRGLRVIGEMEVAWEALGHCPWIGITGTNGKTTVTHLVSHLLRDAGLDAPMCGNVGQSAAELALQRHQRGEPLPDWLVVELSSYQIEAAPSIRPRIGLWTTLTPDHLERHGTLERYRAIKRSLLENSELAILNADDPDLRSQASTWPKAEWVTAGERANLPLAIDPLLWVEDGQVQQASGPLLPADSLAMPGGHNRQNMLLAIAVGLKLGLTGDQMEQALRRFGGVPHRLERVRELAGLSYYNDSKATNYDAAEVALKALKGPLVALAGGEAKQGDPQAWLEQLKLQTLGVVLFGAAAGLFEQMLEASGYPGTVLRCGDLNQAVPAATELALRLGCSAVLLSPACASFDQYSDFEQRGEHFRQLVSGLGGLPESPAD